nr:MAG TPA: hypothetical protein [Crassvirales sp.]
MQALIDKYSKNEKEESKSNDKFDDKARKHCKG